ncbi:MAG TPA: glycerol-3-phosphate dehydrogenase/oxidase [Anaerolineales bacterium]|nr:glycerol-3-phosphate dehydrogenase/oxidase [Anaerolineales bacterium]
MKRNLERLANQKFDVLVVGGGIHGAITAWDAALRGLSVALIERGDFGSGTSQNSLKIIHGGLRYLQDGNLSRIRMMVRERTIWMKIAPHLIHPLPCLMPTTQKMSRSRLTMGIALMANDYLSFDRNQLEDPEKDLFDGMIVSQRELSRILPGYDVSTSTGAAVWYDAQIYNSERLLLEFILSAMQTGAEVANYVEAINFLQQGNRIIGVRAKDLPTGQIFDIQSKLVINCAGAWMNCLLEKAALRSEYATSIAMNVIVDQVWSDVAVGLTSQPLNGKPPQVLFIVPWRNKSMIGTYHLPWQDEPHTFKPNEAMVQEFLDQINSAHPPYELSLQDVRHVTWGFLPVNKADANKQYVNLTRDGVVIDHQKKNGISGLISVLGVKYTTARVVAEQAMDLAVNQLGMKTKKCQTHMTPVRGGKIDDFEDFLRRALAGVPRLINKKSIEHLVYTYGSEYQKLLECVQSQPDLARRIDPPLPVTVAEVQHAVQYEMALTLSDVMGRRTELGSTELPSMAALQKCASLMNSEFQWSPERQQQEIDSVIQAYPFKKTETATA